MQKTLNLIETYLIYIIVALLPLAVSTAFPNPFYLPKLTLIFFGAALVLTLKVFKLFSAQKISFTQGNFDLAVLLLVFAYLTSAIFATPNKMEAFLFPGTASLFLLAGLFYFFVNQMNAKQKKGLKLMLLFSGVLVSLGLLLATAGVLAKIPGLPFLLRLPLFTPLEGHLATAIFLATLIPLGISLILTQKDALKGLFLGVSLALVLFGFGVSTYHSLNKATAPVMMDFNTSWIVTIDALKENPLLGVGSGNYLTAFNRFRPLSYNQNEFWTLRFIQARSFYLTIITETGLLGVAALVFLTLLVYRAAQNATKTRSLTKTGSLATLLALVFLLALFPASPTLIFFVFIYLALANQGKKQLVVDNLGSSNILAFVIGLPILATITFSSYQASRFASAEIDFQKSLTALRAGNGQAAFNLMQSSIRKNPAVDRYHLSSAQLNLALAQAIASNQEGEEIAEADRETISQLIQASIAEAKAAVSLNPQRSTNWEILANVYRIIMPFAQGADAFAIQAYNQAVALDPVNPSLRINLGGVYYALGNYDAAIDVFKLATLAKPDFANAHYNLAVAYREKGEIDKAIAEMEAVLTLVDENTADHELAQNELEALKDEKLSPQETISTENLTPPETEESILNPKIELPEEATPPAVPEEAISP